MIEFYADTAVRVYFFSSIPSSPTAHNYSYKVGLYYAYRLIHLI